MNAEQLADIRSRALHVDTMEAMCGRGQIVGPLLAEIEQLGRVSAGHSSIIAAQRLEVETLKAENKRLGSLAGDAEWLDYVKRAQAIESERDDALERAVRAEAAIARVRQALDYDLTVCDVNFGTVEKSRIVAALGGVS